MDQLGLKKEAGWVNLRKKEKTNGLVGDEKGDEAGQPKKTRENKWINRVKTQGRVGQPKEKRENE